MSAADKFNDVSICANCGKEGDKLKACTACKMVKYCNRECQIAHRPQHKKVCRKRAKELHDIELFKQPKEDDCPICFIQLPSLKTGYRYQTCCGKMICSGCSYAPVYDDQGNEVDNQKCAFCRTPYPTSDEKGIERLNKRVEANDPIAIYNQGNYYRDGRNGYPQDDKKALELYHRAGELGYSAAYYSIGVSYYNSIGVEVDKKKAEHYYELAAMGGDSMARHNLGNNEARAGNIERALKHYMIAVRSGRSETLNQTNVLYKNGHVTKEDYTRGLQKYQAYLGEIKSAQRDKAAAAREDYRYY